MNRIQTKYDTDTNAHTALISSATGHLRIQVIVNRFVHQSSLDELFIYTFDADGNSIEFSFGVRKEDVERQLYIMYETNAAVHRPPFKIEIRHEIEDEDLSLYAFTVVWTEI